MRVVMLVLLCWCASAFSEESILECVDRGRVARDIAQAIEGGVKPENINFAFPNARPDQLADAIAWGEQLKVEVIEALEDRGSPEKAAQEVMETCAYKYGKEHSMRGMQKSSLESDHITQFCWVYVKKLRALYMEVMQSSEMAELRDAKDAPEQAEPLRDAVVKYMLELHPPDNEGYPVEKAAALVREITKVEHPQEWLEQKWKACVANPQAL